MNKALKTKEKESPHTDRLPQDERQKQEDRMRYGCWSSPGNKGLIGSHIPTAESFVISIN